MIQNQFAPGAGYNTGITPTELGFEHSSQHSDECNAMVKRKKYQADTPPPTHLEHLNGRLPIPVVHQLKLLLIRCICIASSHPQRVQRYIPAPTKAVFSWRPDSAALFKHCSILFLFGNNCPIVD